MNIRIRPLVALLLLGLWLPAALPARAQEAQTPEVTVSVDRTRVTVGDPINLTVVVKHAPEVTVQTTSIDDQLQSLEPLSSDPPEDKPANGAMELRLHYKVAAYHTGSTQVPVLTFKYALSDGTVRQVQSKAPVDIAVQSVLAPGDAPTDIRGLKPQISLPQPAPLRLATIGGVIGGVLAVIVLGALAAVWLRRRPRRGPAAVPPGAPSTIEELDRVVGLRLLDQGELVEHYRLIAACVRRYVSERFEIPATALTTAEIGRELELRGADRWAARLITGLLSECDAVVYARYQPARTRAQADIASAYEIVYVTSPEAPPEPIEEPVEATAGG